MNTTRTKNTGRWEFKGFLNIELTEEDKQALGYWEEPTVDELHQAVSTLIGAGYKISVSWSTWEDAYLIAVTCKDVESKYCGYCITLPHENPIPGLTVMRHVYERELATGNLLLDEEQTEMHFK